MRYNKCASLLYIISLQHRHILHSPTLYFISTPSHHYAGDHKAMAEAYAQRASSLYTNLTLVPSIDTAYLLPNNNNGDTVPSHQVLIRTSQTELGPAKKRSSILAKVVSEKGDVCSLPFPFDVTSAPLMVPSPSGRFLALVRVDADKKDEPFIEVIQN